MSVNEQQRHTMHSMAIAVLQNDWDAARQLAEKLLDDANITGTPVLPAKKITANVGKLRFLVHVERDAEIGPDGNNLIENAFRRWVTSGDMLTLALIGVDRVEIYEFPNAPEVFTAGVLPTGNSSIDETADGLDDYRHEELPVEQLNELASLADSFNDEDAMAQLGEQAMIAGFSQNEFEEMATWGEVAAQIARRRVLEEIEFAKMSNPAIETRVVNRPDDEHGV